MYFDHDKNDKPLTGGVRVHICLEAERTNGDVRWDPKNEML